MGRNHTSFVCVTLLGNTRVISNGSLRCAFAIFSGSVSQRFVSGTQQCVVNGRFLSDLYRTHVAVPTAML